MAVYAKNLSPNYDPVLEKLVWASEKIKCIKFDKSNRKNTFLKMHFGLVCQNVFGTDCMASINKKKKKRTMKDTFCNLGSGLG